MPKYSARQAELHLMLGPRGVPRPDDVIVNLKLAIDLWCPKREQLLVDLLDRVTWAHARTDSLPEQWTRLVQAARADLAYHIGVCGVKVTMDPDLRREWQATLREEDSFLEQLGKSPVPQAVDDMNRQHRGLANLIGELDQKWSTLLQSKKEFRTLEQQAVAEADRIVMAALDQQESAIREICRAGNELYTTVNTTIGAFRARLKKTFGELGATILEGKITSAVMSLVTTDKISPGAKEGLKAAASGSQYAINRLGTDARMYLERVNTYRYTLRYDGAVLQMFKANRDLVAAYERDNNLGKVEGLRNQATSAINAWAQAQPRTAMKADGAAFAADIALALQAGQDRCRGMDDNFRAKFNGLFTGPLSDQSFELLGDRYLFEQQLAALKSRGAERRLAALTEQLQAHLMSEIDRSTEPLTALAAEYPGPLGEWLLMERQDFRAFAQQEVKLQVAQLVQASLALSQQLSIDRIYADFDRTPLTQLLR